MGPGVIGTRNESSYSHVVRLGKLSLSHLQYIASRMVANDLAVYGPVKQTCLVLLHWRHPGKWAEVLRERVRGTP